MFVHEEQLAPGVPMLVTDFDGTMTQCDFYVLAMEHLVAPGTPNYWEEYLAGQLTHFEALRHIFAAIRADEAQVMKTARMMGLDANIKPAVDRLQTAGWSIVVTSAGCAWYIDRLLAEQQVKVSVHSNPGELDPERGLVMTRPVWSSFYDESTGISKEAAVRLAIEENAVVAFAGDGRPDLPAAMLVPPERRFARGWLAEELTARQEPFRAFSQWSEIAGMLLEDGGVC